MKVEALVVLPAQVILEVDEGTPIENIRERILEAADNIWDSSGIKAVIHDSNIPELID